MKRIAITLAAVAALAAAAPAGAHPGHGDRSAADPSPAVKRQLAAVKRANAKFRDVRVAERAGYVASSPCTAAPDGAAMGIHYLHPGLAADPAIDPLRPELLLYAPTADGGRRLVGVEYFRADADQDKTTDGDRPVRFGQPFQGPMDGHGPGMPVHYDLHVWLFKKNPRGMFAEFNPRVGC